MRFIRYASIPVVIAALAGCSEPVAGPEGMDLSSAFSLHGNAPSNFGAVLSGAEEVPPVPSRARGSTVFQLSADGSELSFLLVVANIEDVVQAHIHCGTQGVNGPVVLFLYGAALIPGRTDGVLSRGTAHAADVIPRPDSPACPGGVANLDDLVEKMRTGGAYVNVHTTSYLAGEIRGQVKLRGPGR